MGEQIYLDYNATAPARPEVADTVSEVLRRGGNASSIHATGRSARATVEQARRDVAGLIGAEQDWLIFTGSGTEANNQALRCAGRRRVIVTAIEHESVLNSRPDLEIVPVMPDGIVDLEALERCLATDSGPAIVAVMLANNETGVIQPVAEAARLAHRHGALLHCDAVQAAGKIPVDMKALGADFLALSAHKIAGPQGVGVLVARDRDAVARFVHGGGQERGQRAGTENVAGIAGFGTAARIAGGALGDFARLAELRDAMIGRVRQLAPDVRVYGEGRARLPNTAKFTMPGVSSETQVMGMDLAGIAISAGSACAAGTVEPPYVLTAMGVPDAEAVTAVRVSLGWATGPEHIDRFVEAWEALYRRAGHA